MRLRHSADSCVCLAYLLRDLVRPTREIRNIQAKVPFNNPIKYFSFITYAVVLLNTHASPITSMSIRMSQNHMHKVNINTCTKS